MLFVLRNTAINTSHDLTRRALSKVIYILVRPVEGPGFIPHARDWTF
jgi:hypothetical protein